MTRAAHLRIAHLVIGPEQHGVVRHGEQVARACGHDLLRAESVLDLPRLDGYDVLHVPVTDRLLAPDLAAATTAFDRLAGDIAGSGAALSVTLHDVPHDDSPLQRRRLDFYARVMAAARGVVVNSTVELSLVQHLAVDVHSLRRVPLPVLTSEGVGVSEGDGVPEGGPATEPVVEAPRPSVAVLGFVYPDRGYEDVIAALPTGAWLLALGRPSAGHEDLPARYARAAAGRWACTGYLADDELAAHLRAVDVPIAPNHRVTASASINTWLAHGRRPLVPDCAYVRELARDRPDALTVYRPESLADAVAAALADPDSTWLSPDTFRGPGLDEVAAAYGAHLRACAPPAVVRVGARLTVPANRWDLLAAITAPEPPHVSVVIPYFEAQTQLDRTLAALTRQTHPGSRLEIVVADDGSARPPDVTRAGDLRCRVVRQDDLGFRAGAARNLGAAASDGEVLVFLDADTVPEPGFVAALARLPAVCPDVLTVGRRRHADLAGLGPEQVADWFAGRREVPELPEPGWLRDAYAHSANLLRVDRRSYRFVISAVLAMHRELFTELGGFDERFAGYGGEDWELAHRAYVAGAVFAHVPQAVAWHDGPDWAGRSPAVDAKNAETTALALLLPDGDARGSGQWVPYPSIVIRAGRLRVDELLALARSAFAAGADCGIWADQVIGAYAGLALADPRLHVGAPAPDVLARALWQVEIQAGAELSDLPELCLQAEDHGQVETSRLRFVSLRAVNRARRVDGVGDELQALLFGHHDRTRATELAGDGRLDLARVLGRC